MNKRTQIRNYIIAMLQDLKLDVKKIYISRPFPEFLQELPACCIYYTGEQLEAWTGTEFAAKTYRRDLTLQIDIIANADPIIDDYLDKESARIEMAFADDWKLGGLSMGSAHRKTTPYSVEGDAVHTLWATSLTYEIPYETDNFLDKKYKNFEQYQLDINRNGYDDETVDPTLIEAVGPTENNP